METIELGLRGFYYQYQLSFIKILSCCCLFIVFTSQFHNSQHSVNVCKEAIASIKGRCVFQRKKKNSLVVKDPLWVLHCLSQNENRLCLVLLKGFVLSSSTQSGWKMFHFLHRYSSSLLSNFVLFLFFLFSWRFHLVQFTRGSRYISLDVKKGDAS